MRTYRNCLSLLFLYCLQGCAPSYSAHPFLNLVGDVFREAPRLSFFSKDRRRFVMYYYGDDYCHVNCETWKQVVCYQQEQGQNPGLSSKSGASSETITSGGSKQNKER